MPILDYFLIFLVAEYICVQHMRHVGRFERIGALFSRNIRERLLPDAFCGSTFCTGAKVKRIAL